MNRKAIAVYLDNHVKFDIEFSWLWKTWKLWSLDEEWDLVVYYHPEAKQYIDKYEGVIAVEMAPIGMSTEYPFLNSHYFCKEPYCQVLRKYDYLLKTDCDVFLTENLRGFVPSKFMVGQGGYYNQLETNKADYIRSLSAKFGLTYKNMSLTGASFLGKTNEVINVTSSQSHLTEVILKNHVETEEFKNSGFHKGISSMIAGELVINHCFANQHVTLYTLDTKCWKETKIASDVLHIHAWHTSAEWSKHDYFRGEYNDWRVELVDAFSNAANYCHFIATCSIEEILRLRELYKNGLLEIDYDLLGVKEKYETISNGTITEADITVVLNGFKRPQHFDRQLNAIKNQTIRPKKIMFWQNGCEEVFPESSNSLTKSVCNDNLGVWARFAFALNARTEWICIFDDDTIPGNRWFENCLNTMKTHEGLLGTIGIRVHSDYGMYPLKRYGWADINNQKVMEVDFVGHCWFFKREWLSHFWRELPSREHNMLIGEDMHFSIMLRKHAGINTFVPPHPIDDKSLWGSDPELAWKIGTEDVAISIDPENRKKMSIYLEECKKIGFMPIRKRKDFIEDEYLIMKTFSKEIEFLFSRLVSRKPFSFSKYADGEWSMMRNLNIDNGEFKYTTSDAFFRDKLIESFRFKDEEYYVGISCKCCQGENHKLMMDFSGQKLENLTFANIFVNSNYNFYRENFIKEYSNWDVHLVANKNSKIQNLPFNVEKFYPVDNTAWKNNYGLIDEIKSLNLSNKLFLFACGPFGNMLSHQLWDTNKNNTYLDIGSTLNPWLESEGFKRDYYSNGSIYSNRSCIW